MNTMPFGPLNSSGSGFGGVTPPTCPDQCGCPDAENDDEGSESAGPNGAGAGEEGGGEEGGEGEGGGGDKPQSRGKEMMTRGKEQSMMRKEQQSRKPIRYANGEIQMSVNDLPAPGYGLPWGHVRTYSNQ